MSGIMMTFFTQKVVTIVPALGALSSVPAGSTSIGG